MEAVKIVAQALNEIFDKTPLIMKRQIKTGQNAGVRVEGKIDLRQLPSPKIVMINCSFDSGMAALGYMLDPHRLTEVLNSLQEKCNNIEEVSYNPDQRYTGVKVKFKPSTATPEPAAGPVAAGSTAASSSGEAASGGKDASSPGADGGDPKSGAAVTAVTGGAVKCGGQELAFTTAQQGAASDTREIFIGMFPSGKAVITGAVRWEEVRQSYEFARSVLCDHFDYLKVPVAASSAGRKKGKRAASMASAASLGE